MRPSSTTRLIFVLATVWLLPSALPASSRLPNVVFFLVDDLGWRDLGCYGSDFYETPNIDSLAARSVKFTQAYAACHVCSPTRASLMTGKYPARLHLTDWLTGRREFSFQKLTNAAMTQHLPLKEVTIAETLQQHGYRTAHIGKWHLGEDPFGPLQQGFDVQVPRWNLGWPKAGYYAPFKFDGLSDKPGQYLTDRLTDVAEEFIEANRSQPFFLYLSHFAVHDPIQGRADLVAKYQEKLQRMPPFVAPPFILEGNPDTDRPLTDADLVARLNRPAWSGFKVLPERTVKIKQQQDNVQFAAMIEAMDESLGRIIDRLTETGLAENTIIIFSSDNGGMSAANFGRPTRVVARDQLDVAFSTSNLPLRGAKGWLYEGGIRVPLLIYRPGEAHRAQECNVPVISTDIYPTILELAGLPQQPEQHADGRSMVPLLNGAMHFDREALYWHFPHYSNHGMQSPGGAVRAGDYKLLEYFENNTVQLFNLREDIGERQDVSRVEPEKAAELRSLLHAWRKRVSAWMPRPNLDYVPAE